MISFMDLAQICEPRAAEDGRADTGLQVQRLAERKYLIEGVVRVSECKIDCNVHGVLEEP